MAVELERIGKEPILVAHFAQPFSANDVIEANAATAALVKEMGVMVYRIEDVTKAMLDFGDITLGLQEASRANAPGSAHDPQVQFLFVGTGLVVEITAKSFAQEQYAGRTVPLFATVDEAIAYARKAVREGAR